MNRNGTFHIYKVLYILRFTLTSNSFFIALFSSQYHFVSDNVSMWKILMSVAISHFLISVSCIFLICRDSLPSTVVNSIFLVDLIIYKILEKNKYQLYTPLVYFQVILHRDFNLEIRNLEKFNNMKFSM